MSPPNPRSTSALLAESAWLQRLALRLVADTAGAEDAAQETLVRALARPPRATVPLRRWLAVVLRNVVRQERRAQSRRETREQACGPRPDADPADALIERLELHEKLVAAVRGLDEPYRTTVALRFLEDQRPPAVAARMGVPLKTVHTRLERALELLRERLDREHGGRSTWMCVLLPLLPVQPLPPGPAPSAPLAASLLAMSTLWKWTGACTGLVALGILGVRSFERKEPRAAVFEGQTEEPASSLASSRSPEVLPVVAAPREAVLAETHEPATPGASTVHADPEPELDLLRGLVQDLERRPVSGLTVSYAPAGSTPTHPEPGAEKQPSLAGHVVHRDGAPANGAHVSCDGRTTRTDAEGRFSLPLDPDQHIGRMRAVLPGFLPAELTLTEVEARDDLVLTLGGAPLAIRGLVQDSEGRALPGAQVWTTGGERFGNIPTRIGDVDFHLTYDIEGVIAGASPNQADGRKTRSGEDGAFELSGLLDRRYPVYALDPRTLASAGPVEVQAGAELTLTLPDEPRERVAGRVTTFSGQPLVGARVAVLRKGRNPDGTPRTLRAENDLGIKTDEHGRFAFEALCTTNTRLLVSGGEFPDETEFPLDEQTDLAALELAIAAACHVRVTLPDPELADGLGFRDERDQELLCLFQIGGVHCGSAVVQIEGGVSDLLTTDERARTLVLGKGGTEVARVPVRLVPGAVNELRP